MSKAGKTTKDLVPAEPVILDASAMVDVLARTERAAAVRARLTTTVMHAPAHFDAEVLSALGRLQRGGDLTVAEVTAALQDFRRAPVIRHELPALLAGAWERRDNFRLADALYVELAATTQLLLLTTDQRLARSWPSACLIA